MLKISRIFRTIIEFLYNDKYSRSDKLKIIFIFLKLEIFYYLLDRLNIKEPVISIFKYKIYGFNYATLMVLFKEIFIDSEYYTDLSHRGKPLILDCGANIGMATIFFKWRYPNSEIYCFEPDLNTFLILQKNVIKNQLNNVTLYNAAVGDYEGEIFFYNDDDNPGSLRMSTKKNRISKNKNVVNCIKLADFINGKQIDIAKIDIEGAEMKLLEDLNNTGTVRNIKEMFIEYHHKIGTEKSEMGKFLQLLEVNKFEYQLSGSYKSFNTFQDIIIHGRQTIFI